MAQDLTSASYESDRPGPERIWAASWRGEEPLSPSMHFHPGIEVGVVLAGVEEMQYSDFHSRCRAGQVWLCNAWEPHGPSLTPVGTEAVVAIFSADFIGAEMLGETPWLTLFAVPPAQRPQARSMETQRRVGMIGRLLRREIEAEESCWKTMVRALLLGLLIELLRTWDAADRPDPDLGATPDGLARMMPAVSLVHAVPWRRVSVSEAAAACGLSPSRFHEVFRRATGVTFGAFCLRARLSYAANRLLHSDRSISAIAGEAGFVDDSHFRRRFLSLYRCSPAEYRERKWHGQRT